jgi:DNA invertase Pin-like site-specific DNA recombinase
MTDALSASNDGRNAAGNLVGLARVSTDGQDAQLQRDALTGAGCGRIFEEKVSTRKTDRPGLAAALDYVRPGDTLCVWKLDRLGRSVKDILIIADGLHERGIGVRILTGTLAGTYTPSGEGKFFFVMMAAFAELERDLIHERTMAGLAAARAQGRRGGRPTVMDGDRLAAARARRAAGESPTQIAKALGVSRASVYRHLASVPTVEEMRAIFEPPPIAPHEPVMPGLNGTLCMLCGLDRASHARSLSIAKVPAAEAHPDDGESPATSAATAQAQPARPARRTRTARPGKEPKITAETEYEIVKAADYAESRTWQVMVSGIRVGWIRRTWQDTGTSAVWQPVDNSNMPIKCIGQGATPRGNAHTRDKAARELLYNLTQRQDRARQQARQDRQRQQLGIPSPPRQNEGNPS